MTRELKGLEVFWCCGGVHVIALVDGSEASLAAAGYGGRLAASLCGHLTVAVHLRSHWAAAMDLASALPVPADEVELDLLWQLSKVLDDRVLWQLRTLTGDPASAIAAIADRRPECVVVVGVDARGWWRTNRLIRSLSRKYGLPVVVTSQDVHRAPAQSGPVEHF